MKHEIPCSKPDFLHPQYKSKYEKFSWLEYVINLPHPAVLITTLKENGQPNANFHTWGFLGGDGGAYCSIISLLRSYHTHDNILRDREWCINIPAAEDADRCMLTIEHNLLETDEITAAGFTLESAQQVKAPRIKECPISLECTLEWSRPQYDGSLWTVFCGKVIHVAITESALAIDLKQKASALKPLYSFRAQLDPISGASGKGGLMTLKPESLWTRSNSR